MSDDFYSALSGVARPPQRVVVCTVVDSSGSVPQRAGAKVALAEDGRTFGTIGGGAVEQLVLDAARELMKTGGTRLMQSHLTHDLGMCCGGRITVFLETLEPLDPLLIFGAGHVAKPLAALAHSLAFSVDVIDQRPEWANQDRFPRAHRLWVDEPRDVIDSLHFDARSSICIVTHDHRMDQEVLEACLRRPHRYLGVIGSRRKAATFRERLRGRGFSEAEVQGFSCPMGLAIGAQTPEEIAVSICAELIAARRGEAVPEAVSAGSAAKRE
jgi:xanthine dehydrogenase accessory factor